MTWIRRRLAPGRHLPLLVSLIVLFVLYPFMLEAGLVRLMRVGFIFVIFFGVYGLMERRGQAICGVILGVPAMLGQLAALASYEPTIVLVATALALAFLAYMLTLVMRSVLSGGAVTADKIAGAIAAYLLIGLVWALAFGIVATADPGALRGLTVEGDEDARLRAEYGVIYYSFVTLTTLGFGDIVPISPIARFLAWTEAAVGQLFLAILIARLVGLNIAYETQKAMASATSEDD